MVFGRITGWLFSPIGLCPGFFWRILWYFIQRNMVYARCIYSLDICRKDAVYSRLIGSLDIFWKNAVYSRFICCLGIFRENGLIILLLCRVCLWLVALGSSERKFLSFLGCEFVTILPHENWGRTSRKIKKPPNSHPKLKKLFVAEGSHFDPFKKLFYQGYQFDLPTFFRCLCFRTPEGWIF